MAIGPSFYNQADQDLYAGGLQFLPQEQYRLGLGTNTNQPNMLNFNNLTNSGIMSQASTPYILPILNQGGGGGGGGPPEFNKDDSDFDYESEAYGITESELTDDINAINNPTLNKASLAKIGLSSFLGPFSMMGTAYRERKKAEAQAIEDARQNEVARRAAENQAAGTGGYQAGYGSDFMDGGGRGTGMGAADKGGSDSMGSFATGGRVGYFYGGLASIL
jgi:hypothetical protein